MSIFGNCSHRQKLCMHTTYYSVDTGVHGVLLQTVLDNCSGFNCKSNAVCSLSAVWVKPFILCSGQAGAKQGGGIHWAPEAADSSNSLYFTSVHARCDWALAGGSAEQKGKLWTLSRWSLQLLLQISEGSSYHTAWCYPVGAFSGTLCVADSSLAVLQAESHICLPKSKAGSEKESRVLFGVLCEQSHTGEFEMQKRRLLWSPQYREQTGNMPQLSWKLGSSIKEISFYVSIVFIHSHR